MTTTAPTPLELYGLDRLDAEHLRPEHTGRLLTITADSGESITMTLEHIETDAETVRVRGRCLGSTRHALLPPWERVRLHRAHPAN